MLKRIKLACVIGLLLLTCGCQSYTVSGGRGGLPAAADASGLVHGAAKAELAPAAAQRIVAIVGDGDQGLIALAACQSYIKEIVSTK